MNKSLSEFLLTKGYSSLSLTKLKTGHITIPALINKMEGNFILDSGAGGTVVDEKHKDYFHLDLYEATIKGAGAGGSGLRVFASDKNELQVSSGTLSNMKISAMNLSHVAEGLKQFGITEIFHGVIGADFLKQANAVIDYKELNLYIKID